MWTESKRLLSFFFLKIKGSIRLAFFVCYLLLPQVMWVWPFMEGGYVVSFPCHTAQFVRCYKYMKLHNTVTQ